MNKISTALLIAFIFVISIAPVNADSMIAPMSYEIEFEEQDLVFRMILENRYEFDRENSGLYVKSTGEKVYTVHEYYYEGDLYFSADRLSFAAMTWQETNEDKGIIFYNNGVMSYVPVTNLMKNLDAREYSSSHYSWEVYSKRVYDEKNSTLSILTNDGISYTFDIKDGRIIHMFEWKPVLILLIVLGIGAAGLYYVMKKR